MAFGIIFHQKLNLIFSEEDLSALETPFKVIFFEVAGLFDVEAVEHLMKEPHAVDSSFGEQMLNLFFEGELIDDLILDNRLVKLLILRRGTKDKPQIVVSLGTSGNIDC